MVNYKDKHRLYPVKSRKAAAKYMYKYATASLNHLLGQCIMVVTLFLR